MTSYLDIKRLSKRYNDFWALHNIDLQVRKGEVFGLIGPSGAGKTTLLRLIATLEKSTEGKIFFDGLGIPEPDIYLNVGSASHASQTAKIMIEFEKVITNEPPLLVVVVGDVNSTLACSLVSKKLNIKINRTPL